MSSRLRLIAGNGRTMPGPEFVLDEDCYVDASTWATDRAKWVKCHAEAMAAASFAPRLVSAPNPRRRGAK